jgi:DNA-binding response OmpR family regulator
MRIVIIQNDAVAANQIRTALTRAGHRCWVFTTRSGLTEIVRKTTVDLVILDWQAGNCNGLEAARWLRGQTGFSAAVAFCSDGPSATQIAAAFEVGAIDYIIRPIDDPQLCSRVAVVLRRAYPDQAKQEPFDVGPYRIDPEEKCVIYHERTLELTPAEFGIARCLLINIGRPLSRDYIQEHAVGEPFLASSRSLDSQVSALRIKLRLMPERGFQLRAMYGYGYRLDLTPVQAAPADGRVRMVDWSMISNVSADTSTGR